MAPSLKDECPEAVTTFIQRAIGAAILDGRAYEEVEHDSSATGQAAFLVVLTSVALGLGTAGPALGAVASATVAGVAAWCSWAALTYLIGVRVLSEPQTRADMGQVLRTLAFSSAPGLLLGLALVPVLRRPILVVVPVWMLLTMLLAVRHALDYRSVWRAVGVCLLGWGLALAVFIVMGVLFPPVVV